MPSAPGTVDPHLPYVRPWLSLGLLIRQLRSTTWDSATWPTARDTLTEAMKMQVKMRGASSWK